MNNVDRRTLLKAGVGGSLLVPLAGCIDPAETLSDLYTDREEDTIRVTQEIDSRKLRSLQIRFKWRSMYTDKTGTVKTFTESELTKNDDTYTAELSKEQIFENIPTEEPVHIELESTLGDYTKTSSNDRYYMLKYQADGTTHTVDRDTVENSYSQEDHSYKVSTLHQWETDDTIHFKILYISGMDWLDIRTRRRRETYSPDEFYPFLFTLSIPKEKQQALDEYRESLSMISWREFQQEVSILDETFHYYEQDMVTDFATQIKTQLNNYGITKEGADIKLLTGFFYEFIDYDYGGMRNPEYNLRFFSQILEDEECICRGTSFGLASVAYQLGYDVGLQALVEVNKYDFPGAYHMEPTIVFEDTPEELEKLYEQNIAYSKPDEIINGISSDVTHNVIYPGRAVGWSETRKANEAGTKKMEVNRVQFDYLAQA